MKYIKSPKNDDGCVFCAAQSQPDSPQNGIIYRGREAYVILNRFPYTSGHLMVLPYVHEQHLDALRASTRAEMMELATQVTRVLSSLYHPQGFNVGINLGEAAGAGIEAHLHIHIVPRWFGDTNFMTAVGQTRVLPEALDQTWQRVKSAWDLGG